jgi:tripartite ATP-independent transporter DctP family solute receptor
VVPELSLFDAPYMFRDLEHFRRVAGGPIGQELGRKLVEKGGVRILYFQYFGVRQLTTNTPVRKPEDMRGLKIRAVPTPILMATLEGLGARPTPMDFAEVYQSLRSGIVDGQDNPVASIYTSKFYEVQKYLVLTRHVHAVAAAVINEKVYQALSPTARAAVDQGAIEAPAHGNALALRQEAEMLAELRKAGMTVIGPEQGLDIDAFRARVREYVYPKFEAQWTKSLMDLVEAAGK